MNNNTVIPDTLEMFIIEPSLRLELNMLFAAAWLIRKVPLRLVFKMSSKIDSYEKMRQKFLLNIYVVKNFSFQKSISG